MQVVCCFHLKESIAQVRAKDLQNVVQPSNLFQFQFHHASYFYFLIPIAMNSLESSEKIFHNYRCIIYTSFLIQPHILIVDGTCNWLPAS